LNKQDLYRQNENFVTSASDSQLIYVHFSHKVLNVMSKPL